MYDKSFEIEICGREAEKKILWSQRRSVKQFYIMKHVFLDGQNNKYCKRMTIYTYTSSILHCLTPIRNNGVCNSTPRSMFSTWLFACFLLFSLLFSNFKFEVHKKSHRLQWHNCLLFDYLQMARKLLLFLQTEVYDWGSIGDCERILLNQKRAVSKTLSLSSQVQYLENIWWNLVFPEFVCGFNFVTDSSVWI